MYQGRMRSSESRQLFLTVFNAADYAVGVVKKRHGRRWRVVHVIPIQSPFDEREIMLVGVPTAYRVELERLP